MIALSETLPPSVIARAVLERVFVRANYIHVVSDRIANDFTDCFARYRASVLAQLSTG